MVGSVWKEMCEKQYDKKEQKNGDRERARFKPHFYTFKNLPDIFDFATLPLLAHK